MKKYFYIGAFMVLGFLVSKLVHAALEMPALAVIVSTLDAGRTNWLTENWRVVHKVGGMTLTILGLYLGWFFGRKFWQILYVEMRYGKPRF